MPRIVREAEATWEGTVSRGAGTLTAASSGAFDALPVTLASRVAEPEGKTSPEELLAAAHAGCFVTSLGSELARLRPDASTERVEIRDARGALVRRLSSLASGTSGINGRVAGSDSVTVAPSGRAQAAALRSMVSDSMAVVGTPQLPAKAGLNRFTWDMRWPGPWAADARSGRNGPLAAPGRYTVRLVVGDSSWTQPLVLTLDPRARQDGMTDSLSRLQLAHELRARDLVSEANRLVARVARARARLTGDSLARLTTAAQGLEAETVRYGRPGLVTHIAYLYGMTLDADQRVGRDASERLVVLRRELDAMRSRVETVLGSEAR